MSVELVYVDIFVLRSVISWVELVEYAVRIGVNYGE